ncbi:hypothetical protein LWI28_022894 [Acer negundo]|uniref:Epidermal patterning factor-like protein n=1 Tax=Acer negundo TaxID=4023 RepID=A0AAD5IJD4_ACENE|nr:hypothetical protein LWI28_022894 [Acer negundo]
MEGAYSGPSDTEGAYSGPSDREGPYSGPSDKDGAYSGANDTEGSDQEGGSRSPVRHQPVRFTLPRQPRPNGDLVLEGRDESPERHRRDLLFEEKTRLGSMPPSCHNKCNQCHPCMAVQVPTLPRQERLRPGHMEFVDPSLLTNKYSNYKPLGWKCRCNGHFFNP